MSCLAHAACATSSDALVYPSLLTNISFHPGGRRSQYRDSPAIVPVIVPVIGAAWRSFPSSPGRAPKELCMSPNTGEIPYEYQDLTIPLGIRVTPAQTRNYEGQAHATAAAT